MTVGKKQHKNNPLSLFTLINTHNNNNNNLESFAFFVALRTKSSVIMTTTKPRTLFESFTSKTKKQHHFSPRMKGGKDSDLYVAIGVVLFMFFLAFMIAWWNSNTSSRRKSKVR